MKAVYVTRDTLESCAEVWPATVGIRKFHGCLQYGAAWCTTQATGSLYLKSLQSSKYLTKAECRKRFGFYPRKGTAWYVNSRGKRSKVELDFSDQKGETMRKCIVVVLLCVILAGCQTTNGLARDVQTGAGWIGDWTQPVCDRMEMSRFESAVKAQNRLVRRGQNMQAALGR